jgi:hypothetical protein
MSYSMHGSNDYLIHSGQEPKGTRKIEDLSADGRDGS